VIGAALILIAAFLSALRAGRRGHRRAYVVAKRRCQCADCRHQVSLTAGTILHNTKIPLNLLSA
jgi:hypothetical protein